MPTVTFAYVLHGVEKAYYSVITHTYVATYYCNYKATLHFITLAN